MKGFCFLLRCVAIGFRIGFFNTMSFQTVMPLNADYFKRVPQIRSTPAAHPENPYIIYWWENAPYASLTTGSERPPVDVPIQLNLTSLSGIFLSVLGGVRHRCGHLLQEQEAGGVRHVDDDRMWRYVLTGNQLDLLAHLSDDADYVNPDFRSRGKRRPTFFLPFTTHSGTSGLADDALWFAPLVESPGVAHFFRKELEPAASDITDVIKQAWPLVILILLGAAYSGIVIWLLDRLKNPTDFPKAFIPGFWEGFWWAFVTMTTVGYGDTTPRSIQARVYGLVWIVVGITLLSVFTATVTSVLTRSSLISHYSLQGIEVAVLNASEECSFAVSLGAKLIVVNSFEELVESMDKKIAKAAIVDQFVFATNQDKLRDNYLLDQIYPYPVQHGFVVRDASLDMKRCVMTFLAERRLSHAGDLAALVPPIKVRTVEAHNGAQDLFRTETVIYMAYAAAVWAVIFMGFVLWQFLYWTPKHRRRQEMKQNLRQENNEQNENFNSCKPSLVDTTNGTNNRNRRVQLKRRHTLLNYESSKIYKAFKANAKQTSKMAKYINVGFDGVQSDSNSKVVKTQNQSKNIKASRRCSISSSHLRTNPTIKPILKSQYTEIKEFKEQFLNFKKNWMDNVNDAKVRHRRELQHALDAIKEQKENSPLQNVFSIT